MVCLPISAYADTFSVQMVPTDGRHLDFVDDSNPNYEAIIINADVRAVSYTHLDVYKRQE